jgi:GEVED domain/Bacterial Ig domain
MSYKSLLKTFLSSLLIISSFLISNPSITIYSQPFYTDNWTGATGYAATAQSTTNGLVTTVQAVNQAGFTNTTRIRTLNLPWSSRFTSPSMFTPQVPSTAVGIDITEHNVGCTSAATSTSTTCERGQWIFSFSRPVRNPVFHFAGWGTGNGTTVPNLQTSLELVSSSPSGISLGSPGAGSTNVSVVGNLIKGTNVAAGGACTIDVFNPYTAACGSVPINGLVSSLTFKARLNKPAAATWLTGADEAWQMLFTVDQDSGDAPSSYDVGNPATHVVTDLSIGANITGDDTLTVANPNPTTNTLAGVGATNDTDDAGLNFSNTTSIISSTITKVVPLSGASAAGQVCGWIDFNTSGAFDSATERTCSPFASGATSATLNWTVPTGTTASGSSYARIRASYDTTGVQNPVGAIDSGEVEDFPVTLVSAPVNTPPTATTDNYTTLINTPKTLLPLTGDTDPDSGAVLSITSINGVTLTPGTAQTIPVPNGTVTTTTAGVITFTPTTGFTGTSSFPYIISDGQGGSATANEVIEIQNPKIELDKAGTYNDANGNNAGDVGETITYQFTITNTGNVPLTNVTISDPSVTVLGGPISLGVGASDSTTFTATHTVIAADILAGSYSNTATVSGTPPTGPAVTDTSNDPNTPAPNDATVTPIPPFAFPDVRDIAVNTSATYNPLTNDILPSGTTITKINGITPVVGTPIPVTNGTVTLNAIGTFTVTPTTGFTGQITFPYSVTTPTSQVLTATDTINVYKAVDDTKETALNTPITYDPKTNDVLPTGSTITKINGTTPVVGTPINVTGGTVTLTAAGTFTVNPTTGSTTTIVFPYEVTTLSGVVLAATDTITVVKATNDSNTTPVNTPITYDPKTNDVLPAGSTITKINGITPVVGTPITIPNGTVTLTASGTFTVIPANNYTGTLSFLYEVTTPSGTVVSATDTVTITNTPPTATTDNYTTLINTPKTLLPLTGDTDPDSGAVLSLQQQDLLVHLLSHTSSAMDKVVVLQLMK